MSRSKDKKGVDAMGPKGKKPGHTFPKLQAVVWTMVSLLWWYMFFRRRMLLAQSMETGTNVSLALMLAAVTALVALCWWGKLLYDWIKAKDKPEDNGGNDNG